MALCIYGQRAGWSRRLAVLMAMTLLCCESVYAAARPHNNVSVEDAEGLRSLHDIYAVVAREMPGRVLRIKRIRRAGRQAYAVRVLRADGKRGDIVLDGSTLAVIERR
ncbi:MAG TPA: hypothetical protein VGC14_12340 [Rhizobium sp.]